MDDRWRDVGDFEDRARVAGGDAAVTVHVGDGVGVVHHALEPVLGEQHGDAEVVHEASDRREHVLGAFGSAEVGSSSTSARGAVSTEPIATLLLRHPRACGAAARSSAIPRRSSVSSTRLRITSA
jgi:hypothetical protein